MIILISKKIALKIQSKSLFSNMSIHQEITLLMHIYSTSKCPNKINSKINKNTSNIMTPKF